MANVGGLIVDLKAETAAFRADMGKAADALNSSTARMALSLSAVEKGFRTLEAAAAAVGVAVGLGEIASFVKQSAAAAGELGNLSKQLGVSAAGLQAYRFAAAQSGVAQETLDGGIAHLTRTVGAAVDGNDDAIRAFRQLGIGVLDAGGNVRSTDAILVDAAQALSKLPTEAERGRAAFQLFGRSGQQLLSLFRDGKIGIEEFTARAKELGVILDQDLIDRIDKASNRSAVFWLRMKANAAEAFDFLLRVKDAIDDTAAAAGKLQASGGGNRGKNNALALAQQQGGALGAGDVPLPFPPTARPDAIAGGAGLPVSDAEKRRTAEVQNMIAALKLERDSLGLNESEILRLKLSRELDTDATVKAGQEVKKYTAAQVDALVAEKERVDSVKELKAATDQQDAQSAAVREFTALQQRTVEQLSEQASAAGKARVEWDALSGTYRINNSELLVLVRTQEILNSGLQVSADEARAMAQAQVEAQETLRKSAAGSERELKRVQGAVSEMDHFTETVFDHIGQGFATAFAQGETAADRFKAVAQTVLSELQLEMFKLAAINPLKNALFGSNSPTLGDVGGLLGGGMSKLFGGKTPAPSQPEELGLTLPGASDEGAQEVVKAIGSQTGKEGEALTELGGGFGGDLKALGTFLFGGLQSIIAAITGLAASSGAGSAAGGAGGLLGLLGLGKGGDSAGPEFLGGGEGAGGAVMEDLAVTGFAGGTDSAPGGPALVGEQGPEIVNLPRGAQVLPNDVTSRVLGGAGGHHYFIDARGADPGQLRRLESRISSLNSTVEHRSMAAMQDVMRRGGKPAEQLNGHR